MAAGLNWYKADLRELSFVLFEQFGSASSLGKAPFEAWGEDEASAVLDETYRFAREVLGPLNAAGDREGCRVEDGQVKTPKGFKDAWKQLYEARLQDARRGHRPRRPGRAADAAGAGGGAALRREHRRSTCTRAWPTARPRSSPSSARPEQSKRYVGADAQRHVGRDDVPHRAARRHRRRLGEVHRASGNGDGKYGIKGTKIFISGGDHDLADNIIHLVLARVEARPPGTKGLSLFIVPKLRSTRTARVGREQRRHRRLHRAQDGHQRLGDLRAQLRRERRLRRRAGRHRREPRHGADVQDDERRAHRRRHPGPGARRRPRT